MLTVACCTRQLSFLSLFIIIILFVLFYSFLLRARTRQRCTTARGRARAPSLPPSSPPPPAQGVAHRDLKPENILLATDAEDAAIKITDFGLSRLIDDSALMTTACGTPG